VVPDPISSTFTEHLWKHITLTLAALDLGPIAMIAGLGWLLGTQHSANIMNGLPELSIAAISSTVATLIMSTNKICSS
jgi:hypothetical protein